MTANGDRRAFPALDPSVSVGHIAVRRLAVRKVRLQDERWNLDDSRVWRRVPNADVVPFPAAMQASASGPKRSPDAAAQQVASFSNGMDSSSPTTRHLGARLVVATVQSEVRRSPL